MHARFLAPVIAATLALAFAVPGGAATRVLAFGDSITTGLGDSGVTCPFSSFGGFPGRLEAALRGDGLDVKVVNLGKCGEQTDAGVTRMIDTLPVETGKVMLLMEGTNDFSNQYIGVESTRFNLAMMAEMASDAGYEVVSASTIPRAPECGSNTDAEITAQNLATDADALGYVYADPFNAFLNLSNLYETYYAEDDPWHPNPTGYGVLANVFESPTKDALKRFEPAPCVAGDRTLCLNGGRFKVEVRWHDFENNLGIGHADPITDDTGTFWFFNPNNIELVVKVLGPAGNDHFWVFFGALSNVKYTLTVTDTVTGVRKQYINPESTFGSVGDTLAFPVGGAAPAAAPAGARAVATTDVSTAPVTTSGLIALPPVDAPFKGTASCTEDATTLCLNDGRFQVRVDWKDFRGRTGAGQARTATADTGFFWFFRDTNIELVIKVLGPASNGHYWVFYGALSNVEYDIEVTDTMTGRVVPYNNALSSFASVGDTRAFPIE